MSMLAYFITGYPVNRATLKQESGEEVASSQISSSGGLYVRQPRCDIGA